MKLDVVLPAGGRIDGKFAAESGVEVKALIDVGGRTVLERTLDALRETGRVRRAVVVGPREIADHPCSKLADAVLPEGGDSGPANIVRGLEWLSETRPARADRVLIVTTDLPFLTADAILTYIDSCPPEPDVCAPLVGKEAFEASFPGFRRSRSQYVALVDGQWTMGCGFLVNPEAIRANRDRIEQAFAVRRSQIGMTRLLGIGFIVRLLTRTLSVAHIEARCTDMLGCSVKGVPDSSPELAFDLDNIREYRYAAKALAKTRSRCQDDLCDPHNSS